MKKLLLWVALSLFFAACSSPEAVPLEPELETLNHKGALRIVVNSPVAVPSYPGLIVRDSRGKYVARINRTTTLQNLEHGNYSITASSFDIGGLCKPVWKVYVPNPKMQTKYVPAGWIVMAKVIFTEYDLSSSGDCPSPPRPPGDPEPSPDPFF